MDNINYYFRKTRFHTSLLNNYVNFVLKSGGEVQNTCVRHSPSQEESTINHGLLVLLLDTHIQYSIFKPLLRFLKNKVIIKSNGLTMN